MNFYSIKMYNKSILVCKNCVKKHTLVSVQRKLHHLSKTNGHVNQVRRPLLVRQNAVNMDVQMRQIGILVRVIRGVLKLRYLVIGSAVGGSVALNKVCRALYYGETYELLRSSHRKTSF